MSNNQLFLALLGTLLTLLGAFYKILKDYMDAKFEAVNQRFTSVDNQLKFLVEHFVDHNQRISSLETKTRLL
jgi:hypothetical protein